MSICLFHCNLITGPELVVNINQHTCMCGCSLITLLLRYYSLMELGLLARSTCRKSLEPVKYYPLFIFYFFGVSKLLYALIPGLEMNGTSLADYSICSFWNNHCTRSSLAFMVKSNNYELRWLEHIRKISGQNFCLGSKFNLMLILNRLEAKEADGNWQKHKPFRNHERCVSAFALCP